MTPEAYQKHIMRERYQARRDVARIVEEARKDLGLKPQTAGTYALRRPRNKAERDLMMEEINRSIQAMVSAYKALAQRVLKITIPAMKRVNDQFTLVATYDEEEANG